METSINSVSCISFNVIPSLLLLLLLLKTKVTMIVIITVLIAGICKV